MDAFFDLFIQGLLFAGIPLGIVNAIAWMFLKNKPTKATGIFLLCVLVGGMFGYIGCIPLTVFSLYLAFRGSQFQRDLKKEEWNVQAETSGIDEIAKLHALLKAGALTQDEFDQQKKNLLDRAA